MPVPLDAQTERALIESIEARTRARQPAHARGYQGAGYLCEAGGRRFIVKVSLGRGVRGWIRRWMLRREYEAYGRLDGFAGSPQCHGLLRARYLVLDYVEGAPFHHRDIDDRETFFGTLLGYIKDMHRRGVAHADLKRNDNLLVVGRRAPCLIDFGAAVVRKSGFAPINHYLYRLARRLDVNAWAKLKYQGRMEELTQEDSVYYRRTGIEIFARAIKRSYLKLKHRLLGPRRRHR